MICFAMLSLQNRAQRYKKIFIYARERGCIREFYTKCVNFYTSEKGAKRNSIQVETRLKAGNDQYKSTFWKNKIDSKCRKIVKNLHICIFFCTFAPDFILAECAHANRRFEYTVRRAPGDKGDR